MCLIKHYKLTFFWGFFFSVSPPKRVTDCNSRVTKNALFSKTRIVHISDFMGPCTDFLKAKRWLVRCPYFLQGFGGEYSWYLTPFGSFFLIFCFVLASLLLIVVLNTKFVCSGCCLITPYFSVFFLFVFLLFFGGFKGHVKWPEGTPHLAALSPPYLVFCFSLFGLFFVFLLSSLQDTKNCCRLLLFLFWPLF